MIARVKHLPPSIAGLALAAALISTAADAAKRRECQALEQSYAQIKSAASSVERNSLLFSAATQECEALANQLLGDGASLEARDGLGNMPLAKAAKKGNVELVKLFLAHKAPVNARNLEASTALYLAAEDERHAVAELLLEAGADPNLAGRNGIAPLAAAAYTGNSDLVALLLNKGADPRAIDSTGKAAIVYAAGRAHTAVVLQLLDRGIDINARYGNNLTVLMWAAGHSEEAGAADVKETLKVLLSRVARIDDVDDRGRTALMTAVELGHEIAIDALLEAGADRELKDKTGKSAADLTDDTARRARLAQH
ncbi:MAG: ankyrin repeat domain-containing protein [Hyphomicrobium sp.]